MFIVSVQSNFIITMVKRIFYRGDFVVTLFGVAFVLGVTSRSFTIFPVIFVHTLPHIIINARECKFRLVIYLSLSALWSS